MFSFNSEIPKEGKRVQGGCQQRTVCVGYIGVMGNKGICYRENTYIYIYVYVYMDY